MTPSELLALRTVTFEKVPYLIQILRHDGEVIVTVNQDTDSSQFNIWIGYGVDEYGLSTDPDVTVMVGKMPLDIAWKHAVGLAYQMAYALLIKG